MQSIRDVLGSYAEAKRDEIITNCQNGADDDLPLSERPTRSEVSPGCLLKFGDEVEVWGTTIIYLCPGRGVGWFYGIYIDGATVPLGQWEPGNVSDRIPADPNETPMPIFLEP